MELAMSAVVILMIVLVAYVSIQGLDIKKPLSWGFGALAFLDGLLAGYLLNGSFVEGSKVGGAFTLLIMVSGAARRWHKQLS